MSIINLLSPGDWAAVRKYFSLDSCQLSVYCHLNSNFRFDADLTGFLALHDTILATQLRHINRELTPTISEVYHERNIGLGLAPPLSKLLLNQSAQSAPKTDNSVLEKITLGILDDDDINSELKGIQCQRCKPDSCNCKTKTSKPWLSENASALQQIQSSDLTTADILEREVKNKKGMIR